MTIDDAALVRLDELLRDFVSNNRALFGFTEEPTAAAMSAAGWRFFRKGYLVLRDDSGLQLVDDQYGQSIVRRQNQPYVDRYEAIAKR
jgi:hypothetical protein